MSPANARETAASDATLWQSYHAGVDSARDRLLQEHLGLVHHVARQLSRTLAARADFDELVSCGTLGLMAALESFDASRGLAFSTFAAPRIRGAILDELRKQDHVPRSVRHKSREMGNAREAWIRVHGRAPEDRELAAQLNVDVATLWRWQADVEGAHHVSLDRAPGPRERKALAPAEVLPDRDVSDVGERLTHEQEVAHLKDAILQLKEQARVVLSLYYFEELKLHQIATILGLTESRVSQIRTKALGTLRIALEPLRDPAA